MTDDPYPGKVLLTPSEVYKMLGVSKAHFYRKVKLDPSFPEAIDVAGQPRYRKVDVGRWIERRPRADDKPATK